MKDIRKFVESQLFLPAKSKLAEDMNAPEKLSAKDAWEHGYDSPEEGTLFFQFSPLHGVTLDCISSYSDKPEWGGWNSEVNIFLDDDVADAADRTDLVYEKSEEFSSEEMLKLKEDIIRNCSDLEDINAMLEEYGFERIV